MPHFKLTARSLLTSFFSSSFHGLFHFFRAHCMVSSRVIFTAFLDRFANDVLRVCAKVVAGAFVLVGHSFGGAVAAHAASQCDNLVC
jgi:pimeloyl-ACP methyl ester carboxylesterase